MISRKHLVNAHWERLVEIIQGKSEPLYGRLRAIEVRLGRGFGDYEEHFRRPLISKLPNRNWTPSEKADLLACYSGKTEALSRLKADIELAQDDELEGFCPLCGVVKAEEFDHYAPKERFPHVAVHALNLVPCCGRCNRVKSSTWLNAAGDRQVLHFYLDELPVDQFLFAAVSWTSVGARSIPSATFSIRRPRAFNRGKFSLIERHFETMKLLDRYRSNAHHCVSELLRSIRLSRPQGRAAVNRLLKNYAKDNGAVFGSSHWKVVLALSFVNDPTFFTIATT